MDKNNKKYLRPETVKKKVNPSKLTELKTKINVYYSKKEKELLEEIINDYKKNYGYLPSEIDEEILEIIKKQDTNLQAKLLLDVTSIRISFGTLSTFFVYWVNNDELRNNPIFKRSQLEQRLKTMMVHLPVALTYLKFPTIPMQPLQQYFEQIIQIYQKTHDIWNKHFKMINQLIPSSLYLSFPIIDHHQQNISEIEVEAEKESINFDLYTDRDIKHILYKISYKQDEISDKQNQTHLMLNHILIAIQTGFLNNEKSDEKLFQVLEKDEDYLVPIRNEIIEILAQRSLFRAVAGIKQNIKYSKALWHIVQGIEMFVSLVIGLKTLAPEFYSRIFG